MKRIVIYVLILAATLFVPVKGNDIGRLRPVQAVLVYKENQNVLIQTDTEDTGVGQTAKEALQNLKDTTPGVIYLEPLVSRDFWKIKVEWTEKRLHAPTMVKRTYHTIRVLKLAELGGQ